MGFQVYGLIVMVASVALAVLVSRLKRRLVGISNQGWGKQHAGLACLMLTGLFQFLLSLPEFLSLIAPSVASAMAAFSQVVVALGIALILWGVGNVVSSVQQIQIGKDDDEEWRNLYLQLQDLSQQPFSFVEIVNLAVNQLLRKADADGAAVMLFKENTSELILAALSNLSPETAKRFESLKVSGDIFGRAQKLGRLQNVANLSDADKGTEELFAGSGFSSAAVFPLRSRDKVMGSVGLFSAKLHHFNENRCAAIMIATNHLATLLESVRNEKEITRLKDRLKPSEEAKRITEELFFRRGLGGNLALREAVEFERVRKFFDADCIKLVFRDRDGEYRIKASSGGAETGLLLDRRKLTGINRAITERKLLLLTSPTSTPAGVGFDSMPRQTLFIPVPYPDRDDLVLLLESETASLEFSEEKLSAVRVASVYLADLHFLFLAKADGQRHRNSFLQIDHYLGKIINSSSRKELAAALGESCAAFLPNCKGRLILLADSAGGNSDPISDSQGLNLTGETDRSKRARFLSALWQLALGSSEEEIQISKSTLAEGLPADLAERFGKVFSRMPASIRQIVVPVRHGTTELGIVALYFSSDDSVSRESLELCRRLVDLAVLVIRATDAPEEKINPTATNTGANDENNAIRQPITIARHSEPGNSVGAAWVERPVPANREAQTTIVETLKWHNIDADVDLAGRGQTEDAEFIPTVEKLVRQLFAGPQLGRLYLSSFSDEQCDYFQLTSNNGEMLKFRGRELEAHDWTPCLFARELPEAFRTLAGDYQSRRNGERVMSLTWKIPHVVAPKVKARRVSILGIDDQEVIRELLNSIISRMGHRIVSTENGEDGLRLFKEGHFDLVIIEAGLPGISGWDIAEQVKALSPDTPVIMLSGWDPQVVDTGSRRPTADFVLAKPFRVDQLGSVIGAACELIATKQILL
jgi:CheY-like chemotaxis protein